MRKAFLISGAFISSFIGAGFASGNEILFYFSKYGVFGILGITMSVFVFSVLQVLVISQANNLKAFTIDKYVKCIMNDKLSNIISFISYVFMTIVFSAMLSGFGELVYVLFGIKRIIGIIFMLILCYLILFRGYKTFLKCEAIMSLIIVFIILFTVLYILIYRERTVCVSNLLDNWYMSSASYVGYNFLTGAGLLCVLGREYDKNSIKKSGIITFLILSGLMLLLWYIIMLYNGMINLGTIPMLTVAIRQSKGLGYIYSVSIFVAMLTTAISNCYTLSIKLNNYFPKYLGNTLIISFGLLFSGFDFAFIIDKLYRISGIISLFFIYYVLKYHFYQKSINNQNI